MKLYAMNATIGILPVCLKEYIVLYLRFVILLRLLNLLNIYIHYNRIIKDFTRGLSIYTALYNIIYICICIYIFPAQNLCLIYAYGLYKKCNKVAQIMKLCFTNTQIYYSAVFYKKLYFWVLQLSGLYFLNNIKK